MSREIKFRCWFNDRMWYGIPAIYFDENGIRRVDLNHEDDDRCLTPDTWTGEDDYVLMQYTGIDDNNNRNIYEGDIVRVTLEQLTGDVVEHGVIWISPEDGVMVDFPQYGATMGARAFIEYDGFTIVGNEHENPELLG